MDTTTLHQLAAEVQDQIDNALHLLGALDDALDDVIVLSGPSGIGPFRREEAMDRVAIFLRLAKEASRLAGAAGGKIELLVSKSERQRAAARRRTN
ncbi:hypothetical protein V474_22825 [Novosphingobium barchaimii LL02]|uniref:Uncharacterized protein n=1 Tax=Novosphingobium barchaimii LL02 TaxID=1114963 RepID=A0A0J7XPL3_9SPHN|nr:hypothetical protein [Novosphingobium barchaimii]KMS53617.1 hypothetical protein V474_22825 [Novosphingobium barchaimii LL02]